MVGVLGDATGYKPTGDNTLGKLFNWIVHFPQWELDTTAVAVITIVVWAIAHRIKRIESMATLVALVVVSAGAALAGLSIERVGDIATIPSGLPSVALPDVTVAPQLLVGAIAVSLVALAQAAGISAAVPNPDGSRPNASGDFWRKDWPTSLGVGSRRCRSGGSLSRTAWRPAPGAQTRWAGIFAGLSLAILVVLFGSLAEIIPMAVIGGLIIVIGGELLVGRVDDIRLVIRTSPMPAAAMVVTFLAHDVPAAAASDSAGRGVVAHPVLRGSFASGPAHCTGAVRSRTSRPLAIRAGTGRGAERRGHHPAVAGSGLFAEVAPIDEHWPRTTDTHDAAIILVVRTLPDIPSTTLLNHSRVDRIRCGRMACASCSWASTRRHSMSSSAAASSTGSAPKT